MRLLQLVIMHPSTDVMHKGFLRCFSDRAGAVSLTASQECMPWLATGIAILQGLAPHLGSRLVDDEPSISTVGSYVRMYIILSSDQRCMVMAVDVVCAVLCAHVLLWRIAGKGASVSCRLCVPTLCCELPTVGSMAGSPAHAKNKHHCTTLVEGGA